MFRNVALTSCTKIKFKKLELLSLQFDVISDVSRLII